MSLSMLMFFCLLRLPPPISTRTDTPFPSTTLFRAGGVATAHGIALFSNAGIRRYYKGLLRNVEISGGPDLPAADARIGDVEAEDAGRFLAHLQRRSEEHTSELQSLMRISYAVFCLKKKISTTQNK